jgi:hypothetical protein
MFVFCISHKHGAARVSSYERNRSCRTAEYLKLRRTPYRRNNSIDVEAGKRRNLQRRRSSEVDSYLGRSQGSKQLGVQTIRVKQLPEHRRGTRLSTLVRRRLHVQPSAMLENGRCGQHSSRKGRSNFLCCSHKAKKEPNCPPICPMR